MSFFQANMQTGILVLLIVLVAILCVALFFTNKEVRNIKTGFVKNKHDIVALQSLLNDVGLSASGGNPDLINGQDEPTSSFGPPFRPGDVPPGMFPPGMLPPGFVPTGKLSPINEEFEGSSLEGGSPEPLPADTESAPANLDLTKPQEDSVESGVIPSEDVEEVKESVKEESGDGSDGSDDSSSSSSEESSDESD